MAELDWDRPMCTESTVHTPSNVVCSINATQDWGGPQLEGLLNFISPCQLFWGGPWWIWHGTGRQARPPDQRVSWMGRILSSDPSLEWSCCDQQRFCMAISLNKYLIFTMYHLIYKQFLSFLYLKNIGGIDILFSFHFEHNILHYTQMCSYWRTNKCVSNFDLYCMYMYINRHLWIIHNRYLTYGHAMWLGSKMTG